jgi:hypothetical protein
MPEWEFNTGTVTYEVDMALAADSGREKHTNIREQGGWLLNGFIKALESVEMPGLMVSEVRQIHEGEVVNRRKPKAEVVPFDTDLNGHLFEIVRDMSMLIAEILSGQMDEDGTVSVPDYPEARELMEIVRCLHQRFNHVEGAAPLDRTVVRADWVRAIEG